MFLLLTTLSALVSFLFLPPETIPVQIQLVSLFNNQSLGLQIKTQDHHSIHFLESSFDHFPSYYTAGWYPHPARTFSVHLNLTNNLTDYLAYPIYQSTNGFYNRVVSILEIASQSSPKYIDQFQYQDLINQIYQPTCYSTVNLYGYTNQRWAQDLYQLKTIGQLDQFWLSYPVNFFRPIVYLWTINVDAVFYYFPRAVPIFCRWLYNQLWFLLIFILTKIYGLGMAFIYLIQPCFLPIIFFMISYCSISFCYHFLSESGYQV